MVTKRSHILKQTCSWKSVRQMSVSPSVRKLSVSDNHHAVVQLCRWAVKKVILKWYNFFKVSKKDARETHRNVFLVLLPLLTKRFLQTGTSFFTDIVSMIKHFQSKKCTILAHVTLYHEKTACTLKKFIWFRFIWILSIGLDNQHNNSNNIQVFVFKKEWNKLSHMRCAARFCTICTKNVKITNEGMLHGRLKFLHECFSRFLNCTNGTKQRNAPQYYTIR